MRRWFANRSLRTKFAVMIVGILVITMSALGYLYLYAQYEQSVKRLSSKGQALGRFVSFISPTFVLSYDFEGMNDFMVEVSREPEVIYGVLIAQNGISLTRYLNASNPYVRQAMSTRRDADVLELVAAIDASNDVMTMRFPVQFDGRTIAQLQLGLDQKPIAAAFQQSLVEMLIALAALIAFLASVLYIGFRVMALRPIRALHSGLNRVATGDMAGRIPIMAKDEIGGLTNSFNDMVDRLRRTIAEKDGLTEKLQQQAAELARVNRALEARLNESARVMRDLHDDVGARLLTLSHRCDKPADAETARAALQHLRQTIRGLDRSGATVYLADVLADWEAEARERLDAAGVQLAWEQSDSIPEAGLNNRQYINLGRILREAMSNAIHHAHPSLIHVTADVKNQNLCLRLCDDGNGSNPATWTAGTGLNNMTTRAKELGATVRWLAADPASGCGVCVELICPLAHEDYHADRIGS